MSEDADFDRDFGGQKEIAVLSTNLHISNKAAVDAEATIAKLIKALEQYRGVTVWVQETLSDTFIADDALEDLIKTKPKE